MADRPKLGEILVRAGVVQPDQVRAALQEQQEWGGRLGQTLIAMGVLSERDLVRALASQLGLPVVHLAGKRVDPEVLELLPVELVEKHRCLPLFVKMVDGVSTLHLGMEDPSDVEALDDVRGRCAMPIAPIMVSPSDLHEAILRCHPGATLAPPPESHDEGALLLDEVSAEYGDVSEQMQIEHDPNVLETKSSLAEELESVGTAELLTALTQLLIENDLLDRGEIAARIRSLRLTRG